MKEYIAYPNFSLLINTIRIALLSLVVLPGIAFFLIPIFIPLYKALNLSPSISTLISILLYIGLILLAIYFIKLGYKNTKYIINENGIFYKYDFIWTRQLEISHVNIKEVELKRGPLQRMKSFGSVEIRTHATMNRRKASVILLDLKDYEGVYDLIKGSVAKTQQS